MTAKLFYFHDPMCSWCWGFAPTWERLVQQLTSHFPKQIRIKYILGGLAPDTDQPMPPLLQDTIKGYWQTIHKQLGTPFNFDFWQHCQPRRSTYPACRAVIAATQQGAEKSMITALQEAYYQRALNPSDTETHLLLAQELNLEIEQFTHDLRSQATEYQLQQQIQIYRKLSSNGFPSLVLQTSNKQTSIPVDYKQTEPMFAMIKTELSSL